MKLYVLGGEFFLYSFDEDIVKTETKEVGFKEGLVNVSSRPPGPDTGVPGIAQVLSYADLCGLRQSLVNMCVCRR